MLALAPLRAGQDGEEGGDAGDRRARSLAVALHCCGSNINYERILSTIGHVYPAETAFSWNFEGGNPSLEHVLENTSLRVWGTYPRGLLRDAVDPASVADLESFLLRHRQWLEEAGHLHRVVIGPDCCPGAFIGEEVPAIGWGVVQRAYQQWLPDAGRPERVRRNLPVKATIFRHFYSDDATPEGLAARTLELTRSATVIKLTPDPYFMTLSFGGRAAPRERNDVRPALAVAPVPPEAGAWQDFGLRDRTHIDRVLAAVRLLKASPEASGKPLYVNVFAPFTVAMQCDGRLVERLADASERPAVARGLAAIASATAEYIRELAAAGADGVFYANKCMRHELGALVDDWVVPMDMLALAPLRAGQDGEEGEDAGDQRARSLAVALHCCGSNINYERILSTIGHVYPAETAFSWNFEGGNPSLEHVLENTSLRVWGTYPRGLLRDAVDPASAADLESFLLRHRQWLEKAGHLHRVVIGPDCCPGAFIGEEVPAIGWGVVQRAYQQWLPDAGLPERVRRNLPVEATIFRHFYSDDATPEGLAARTLELTRSATVIKLTPDPYFMTLSFGGRAAPR